MYEKIKALKDKLEHGDVDPKEILLALDEIERLYHIEKNLIFAQGELAGLKRGHEIALGK